MPTAFPAAAEARLHIVTGKGGTGKTTVAAALALALAGGGHRTLLIEVEGRQGIAQLFDVPPLPYEERRIAVAPGGGEVRALAVDAEQALIEYLEMFYNLKRAGGMLKRMGAIDFATTIAPGMRDVLLTGKVKESTTRMEGGRRAYDAVVLDAPPTGRIVQFLNVTAEVAGLTKVGPINKQSQGVMKLFRSPQTVVHIVTLLEEMPVQETCDAVDELTRRGLPVGGVIVNMTRAPLLPRGRVDRAELARGLAEARLPHGEAVVSALLSEANEHTKRVALERRERRELSGLRRPLVDLPFVPDGVDLGALHQLAGCLREQGLRTT